MQLFRNTTKAWCDVTVEIDGDKQTITSTPGHKYYLPENTINRSHDEVLEHASYEGLSNKWVSAQDLKFGDKVLLSDGKYGIVVKVKTRQLAKSETTYNFEVADFHTYFVGENSMNENEDEEAN